MLGRKVAWEAAAWGLAEHQSVGGEQLYQLTFLLAILPFIAFITIIIAITIAISITISFQLLNWSYLNPLKWLLSLLPFQFSSPCPAGGE